LILLPRWMARWRARGPLARPGERARVAAYFLAIGFAFMFVEIAFIQKFVLLLSHPIHSVAAVLGTFLVFAGFGSRVSRRLSERVGRVPPVSLAVVLIGAMALAYLFLLPHLFDRFAALPQPGRIALAVALVAPLAFWMGMPFPIALSRLRDPQLVAWAWGVNGFASVVAAVLAALLSIHLGFNAVVLVALVLYGVAAVAVPRAAA
jgi:MFS family permease